MKRAAINNVFKNLTNLWKFALCNYVSYQLNYSLGLNLSDHGETHYCIKICMNCNKVFLYEGQRNNLEVEKQKVTPRRGEKGIQVAYSWSRQWILDSLNVRYSEKFPGFGPHPPTYRFQSNYNNSSNNKTSIDAIG